MEADGATKSLFAAVRLGTGERPYTEQELEVGLPWSNWHVSSPEGLYRCDRRLGSRGGGAQGGSKGPTS